MKIVINSCHGGFGLSHKAIVRYLEMQGKKVWIEENEDWEGRFNYWLVPKKDRVANAESEFWTMSIEEKRKYNQAWSEQVFNDHNIERNDPFLVRVVEELGLDANNRYSELKVVEIPDDVEWQIDEYDGSEWVSEKHRTWS